MNCKYNYIIRQLAADHWECNGKTHIAFIDRKTSDLVDENSLWNSYKEEIFAQTSNIYIKHLIMLIGNFYERSKIQIKAITIV